MACVADISFGFPPRSAVVPAGEERDDFRPRLLINWRRNGARPMTRQLQDRVAIVTGASNGIGRAIAETFAAEGAKTVLVARRAELLDEVAAGIEERGGHALPVPADLTKEEQVVAVFDRALKIYGRLDVLVNNAGLGGETPLVDMTDDEWDRVLNVTLTSVMRATRAALRYFRDVEHGGVIVNNASVLGWRAQQIGRAHV